VLEPPLQMEDEEADAETVGAGFTVTVTFAVPVHPDTSVPTTV
jgi:hypothetical protein